MKRRFAARDSGIVRSRRSDSQFTSGPSSSAVRSCAGFGTAWPSGATSGAEPTIGVGSSGTARIGRHALFLSFAKKLAQARSSRNVLLRVRLSFRPHFCHSERSEEPRESPPAVTGYQRLFGCLTSKRMHKIHREILRFAQDEPLPDVMRKSPPSGWSVQVKGSADSPLNSQCTDRPERTIE